MPARRALRGWRAVLPAVLLPALVRAQTPSAVELVFPAVADTYVDSGAPTTNFDASVLLRADASPVRVSYLRFAVTGVAGRPVLGARLRLGVSGMAPESGGTVHPITNHTWNEATVTWATRPPVDGPGIATLGPTVIGTVVEFDLGTAIAGDGVYDFALDNTSTNSADYASKQAPGGPVPALVLTVAGLAEPHVELLPVADVHVDAGAPTTNFGASPLLRADADVTRISYLRFLVTGVDGARVGRAVLRLVVDTATAAASDSGGTVHALATHLWHEAAATWATRPPLDGPPLATLGPVLPGEVVDVDVTAAVAGDGVVDLALVNASTNGVDYRSRETATPPRLLLTLASHPPSVTVAAPGPGAVFFAGSAVELMASAADVEDGDLGAAIQWMSSLDGPLGTGPHLDVSGLRIGTHTITAAVSDSQGVPGAAAVTVRVRGANQGPTIGITSPADGAAVPAGTAVTLAAVATDDFDPDPGAAIRWRSSADGPLGSGPELLRVLSEGVHTVTAEVTDGDGASASAAIVLAVTPTPPVVTITAPAAAVVTVPAGRAVTLAATAGDATDGDLSAALAWTSDIDGPLGTGPTVVAAGLAPGMHVVTAAVTDSGGLAGEATRTVVVREENAPPEVVIGAPADGTVLVAGTATPLLATADDAEDGDLNPAVRWTSTRDGVLGTGAALTVPALSTGQHGLTAAVTDRDGATASAAVTVTVRPPTLTFLPAADTYVDAGSPTRAFGTTTGLLAGGSPVRQAFIRFVVSDVAPLGVERAVLRLTVGTGSSDGSGTGGTVRPVSAADWPETTTYRTRPPIDGPPLASRAKVSPKEVVDFDVTAALTGDGPLGLALESAASDPVRYQSRETAAPPQLVVTLRNPALPVVTIAAPAPGASLRAALPVAFAGTAADPQDGDLSAALTWTSSRDGVLGVGRAFGRMLSPGTHTITATVADAQGNVGRATVAITVPASATGDLGFRDFPFPGAIENGTSNEATASKPEAKLWFADGLWWATLFRAGLGHRIHRLDRTSETWIDTGVTIDRRPESRQDVLWDGTRLYVVSRFAGTPAQNRLLRYAYDPATPAWSLDSGFPVDISGGGTEALTLAKDSTGTLWIAYTLGRKVVVNRSLGSDAQWGTPFTVPVTQGTAVDTDDIAAVVALPATHQVGVFWSNQATQKFYFAVHDDGAPPTDPRAWRVEVAAAGSAIADDHLNVKVAADGRVFAAVKTGRAGTNDTGVGLLVRAPGGVWSPLHRVATAGTLATRPLCLLDEVHRRVYVFYAPSHATIAYKASPMDAIAFPSGGGTPFMSSTKVTDLNNPTSTKQAVTAESGIEVVASSRAATTYWHNGLAP